MKNNYKEFLESQDELRKQVFNVLKKNPKPINDVAQEMGISNVTLFRFLKEEHDVDFVRLTKIENWVKKHE